MASAAWTCPDCGKGFARANQPHSCKAAEDAFASRPPWMKDAASAIAKALAGCRVEPNSGGWHYAAKSTFAAAKPKAKALRIEFYLAREVQDERIVKVERHGPTRIAHHVDLTTAPDKQLLAWLKEAQELRS